MWHGKTWTPTKPLRSSGGRSGIVFRGERDVDAFLEGIPPDRERIPGLPRKLGVRREEPRRQHRLHVDSEHVVVLPVVRCEELPVEVLLAGDRRIGRLELRESIRSEDFVEFLQARRERLRVGIEVDEDPALPDLRSHLRQRAVLLLEARVALHLRRGHEVDRSGRSSRCGRDRRSGPHRPRSEATIIAAMPADRRQGSDLAVLASDDDQGLAEEGRREVVAGLGDVLDPPDREPFPPEHVLLFRGVEIRIGVGPRREAAGMLPAGLHEGELGALPLAESGRGMPSFMERSWDVRIRGRL